MKAKVKFLSAEYETLVAAYTLRDAEFTARAFPILRMAHNHFWGRDITKLVVGRALDHFEKRHSLLGYDALAADLSMAPPDPAIPKDHYLKLLDGLWRVDVKDREFVLDGLAQAAKERLLLALNKDDMVQSGRANELVTMVKEIDDLTRVRDKEDRVYHITDDIASITKPPEDFIPFPWAPLNECLTAGGMTPGETFIVAAPFNTGKSPLMANCVIHSAKPKHDGGLDRPSVFFTYETSRRNTHLRILRTLTGWSQQDVYENPGEFAALVESYRNLPLFIRYRPAGTHSIAQMEADIHRIEDGLGRKIEMVARDYGELSYESKSKGGDYRAVREAYQDFRAFLGRTGRVGLDAAQLNRQGQISNFDILKDADIGITLTRAQGREILMVEMTRIREGSGGREFFLYLNLKNGRMEVHEPVLPDAGGACAQGGMDIAAVLAATARLQQAVESATTSSAPASAP